MRAIQPNKATIELSMEDLDLIRAAISLFADINEVADRFSVADVDFEYTVEGCNYTDREITDIFEELEEEIKRLD